MYLRYKTLKMYGIISVTKSGVCEVKRLWFFLRYKLRILYLLPKVFYKKLQSEKSVLFSRSPYLTCIKAQLCKSLRSGLHGAFLGRFVCTDHFT